MTFEVAIVWDDADKLRIGNEVSRLFALQDIPLGKDKKAIFIEELAEQGLPVDVMVDGLRSLADQELSSIKIHTIIDAAHSKLPQGSVALNCEHCFNGEIIMRDDQRREWMLACTCPRGKTIKGLATWNGEENFFRRGRWLTLVKKIPMEVPSVPE